MANKKIISFTTLAVFLVVAGIIVGSKLMETSWQNTGESENNLNVDESNLNQEKILFNYPFVIDNGETIEWNNQYITNPPAEAITWQEAANIAGETLKDILGLTEHQKITAKMCYYECPDEINIQFPDTKYYYYSTQKETVIDSVTYDLGARVFIDAYTGEPTLVQYIDKINNDNVEWQELTDNIKTKLLSDTTDILTYLGKPGIERFILKTTGLGSYLIRPNIIKSYELNAVLTDGTYIQFLIDMDGSTDNKLLTYQNLNWLYKHDDYASSDWEMADTYLN